MSNTPSESNQEMLAELRKALGTMNDIAARAEGLIDTLSGEQKQHNLGQVPSGDELDISERYQNKAWALFGLEVYYGLRKAPPMDTEGESESAQVFESMLDLVSNLALCLEAIELLDLPRFERREVK